MNNGGRWSWNNPGYHPNNQASNNFDTGYLDEHPEVSQQLARNPGLADNPQYLAAHPGLQDYLNAHPNVHYDLEHHPDRFMSKEDRTNGYPTAAILRVAIMARRVTAAPVTVVPAMVDRVATVRYRVTVDPAPTRGPGTNHHEHPLGTADNYFDHHHDVYHQMQAGSALGG